MKPCAKFSKVIKNLMHLRQQPPEVFHNRFLADDYNLIDVGFRPK